MEARIYCFQRQVQARGSSKLIEHAGEVLLDSARRLAEFLGDVVV